MKVAIILCGLAVAAYCAPSSTAKPDAGGVKEAPADGHRRRHHGGWGFPSNPIVDRNVCDLDASVLVVVEGGRRGYNKARRVKCADVAAADEDSCMVCCQNAARRDSSIRNEDIFGFLTVIDHFEKDDDSWSRESHDDDYARRPSSDKRPKRQAEGETTDETEAVTVAAGEAEYGRKKSREQSLEDFEPIKNFKNLKCLCCAPRRQLPPPIVVPVPVPVYTQQYQQQYPQAAAPQQYQPAQAPPTYQTQAALAQAQPSYQAQAAPAQYQPAQAQPSYQAPAAAPAVNY
ncbi:hypothetical protein PRIPAC_77701 [Pristionchus pacificus]|uniref:Uncharacterized protein n=1 Tax=Pristionchus pacificus TaxID=54126 RepID=A0A2A6BY69_PRIPA|nr:hypothetical protein PRIPAC_77701 [Pristionchus pacificus]|eukprot:PDM70855.1 hypothetical protein PRIPAC_45059 [Pristionchus pacificus]